MERNLARIEKEPLPQAILIYGLEQAWHQRIFGALQKRISAGQMADWNWAVFYGSKDFEEGPLLAELAGIPWGGEAKIVVLREANLIPAAIMESIANWLKDKGEGNCLAVFLEQEKLDARLRYIKIMRKYAWEISCQPLQEGNIVRYVQDYCGKRAKSINPEAAVLFADRVGGNLLFIENELEKLFSLTEGRREITKEDVEGLTSFSPAQIENKTIFEMTDFISQGRRQKALEVLELLLKAGEAPLRILPLIERQLRLILAAKTSTVSLEKTARQMGEKNSYALKKVRLQAKEFSVDQVLEGFAAVVSADQEMKLGASGDQVLRELIVRLT